MLRTLLLLVGLMVVASDATSYHPTLKPRMDGTITRITWQRSGAVPYFVNSTKPLDFSLDEAVAAVQQSFQTWEDVDTATITFDYAGLTDAEPSTLWDGQNTLGFSDDEDLLASDALGVTYQLSNIMTGEILEADIAFSNAWQWSVEPQGKKNHIDFVSTATHEIGHVLGLNHSHVGYSFLEGGAVFPTPGAAIMYSFGFGAGKVIGRFLKDDDIAGVSLLYPSDGYRGSTGHISGRVTKAGRGVGYAHIVAFNPGTGITIGAFADSRGDYIIEGLSPGPHIVRVNPITDPNSPSDFSIREFVDRFYRDELYQGREIFVNPGSEIGGIDVEVSP